jgi:hypothetical protein
MGIPLRLLMIEDSEDDALLVVRELKFGGYDVEYKRVAQIQLAVIIHRVSCTTRPMAVLRSKCGFFGSCAAKLLICQLIVKRLLGTVH